MVTPTLQELRTELDARAIMARLIMDAMRRGDLEGCERAQAEMRQAFTANGRRAA
jgi:hypothetical protein